MQCNPTGIEGTCLFGPAAYYPAFRGLQHGIRRVTEGWTAGRIPLHNISHVRLYNFAPLFVPQPARRRGHSVVRMGVYDSAEDSWCAFARLNFVSSQAKMPRIHHPFRLKP